MARRCRHSIPQPAYGGLSARAVNVIAQEETRAVLLRKTLMAYARDMQKHVPRVCQRDYSASPFPSAVLRGRRLRDDAVFRAAFFLGAEVSSPVTEASAAGAVVSAELSDVCAAFFLVFFAAGLRGSRGLRR